MKEKNLRDLIRGNIKRFHASCESYDDIIKQEYELLEDIIESIKEYELREVYNKLK